MALIIKYPPHEKTHQICANPETRTCEGWVGTCPPVATPLPPSISDPHLKTNITAMCNLQSAVLLPVVHLLCAASLKSFSIHN